jgi:tRNA pseudouridine55 synthase
MMNEIPLPATLRRELHLAEGDVLLVDKPAGWTSFDVVNKIRRLFRVPKVGHAGTLDPLATGLLIVCTGKMTKEISGYMAEEKEYEAAMMLGACTASFDAETPVEQQKPTDGIHEADVRRVLAEYVGIQQQLPPMWSAAKVKGRRLYEYAQRGKTIDRPLRDVTVKEITPLEIAVPEVKIRVVCSKGTYIRTLVHDIGQTLGCGAYVTSLRRTRIGKYLVADAACMDDLIRFAREAVAQPV